jgi:hypothetical protein
MHGKITLIKKYYPIIVDYMIKRVKGITDINVIFRGRAVFVSKEGTLFAIWDNYYKLIKNFIVNTGRDVISYIIGDGDFLTEVIIDTDAQTHYVQVEWTPERARLVELLSDDELFIVTVKTLRNIILMSIGDITLRRDWFITNNEVIIEYEIIINQADVSLCRAYSFYLLDFYETLKIISSTLNTISEKIDYKMKLKPIEGCTNIKIAIPIITKFCIHIAKRGGKIPAFPSAFPDDINK